MTTQSSAALQPPRMNKRQEPFALPLSLMRTVVRAVVLSIVGDQTFEHFHDETCPQANTMCLQYTTDLDPDDVTRRKADAVNARSAPVADSNINGGEQSEVKEREKPVPLTINVSPSSNQTNSAEVDIIPPSTPTKALLPMSETEGMTSGAVQPPGSTGAVSPSPSFHVGARHTTSGGAVLHATDTPHTTVGSFTGLDESHGESEVEQIGPVGDDDKDPLILNGGTGIPIGPDGEPRPLLPPIAPQHSGRKCLVLDLDETLVHSSFAVKSSRLLDLTRSDMSFWLLKKSIPHADYVVPVEIGYRWHDVNVIKRPGVDHFLQKMGEIYEVVVFTASLRKFADPVLDKLDVYKVVSHRLFRESCHNYQGSYVKDLSKLGRPIADTIILDNSPASYIFHPNNAVPVSSWFDDPHDTELTDLCPFLADLGEVRDVRGILDGDML